MNISLLKQMHKIWLDKDLLGDTANLDFTTIPYWGDDDQFENNWAGKRNKALGSMLAVLAHDPDTGIIDYGRTDVKHKNESGVVLEFLDFYRSGIQGGNPLKYIVFDSKFTNYENLGKLDDNNVKFITNDFDLTMSILAHNIYRLFALDLEGYSHMTSQSIY